MSADNNILQQKARLYKKIRAFFDALEYLEVCTPLLNISTNTDVHIQSITAQVCGNPQYLQTSPEFEMKKLLCAGSGSIYQIAHAFRDEEQGRVHRAEFSLLEWYSVGFDYQTLIDQLEKQLSDLLGHPQKFKRIGYADAFKQSFGIDIHSATATDLVSIVLKHIAGFSSTQMSKDDCLDLLMSQVIAKQFEGFTIVYDYPSSMASLAQISTENPAVAERFELFYGDLELANGFSELTDGREQRARFLKDNRQRSEIGLPVYPLDEAFLQALELKGLPECSGVAVGLDRLLMVMLNIDDIAQLY